MMEELINKVIQWANDRNLIKGSDAKTQCLKLVSEFGELNESMISGKNIKDDIGDCMVVCILLCEIGGLDTVYIIDQGQPDGVCDNQRKEFWNATRHLGNMADSIAKSSVYKGHIDSFIESIYAIADEHGLTSEECLEYSYEQIKNRKGVMIEGIFIKESDERYTSAVREIRGEA